MPDTRFFFEGAGEAVRRDDTREGTGVDGVHEANGPVRDVKAFQRLLDGPVRNCAEGRLEVQVGYVGGKFLAVALLVQAGDEGEGLGCAHAPEEAVLDRVDGRLGVPGVVDRRVEVHGQQLEWSLEQRDGPEVLQVRSLGRVLLQRVEPAALPALRDHAVFQGVVHQCPNDFLEVGRAEGDERVAEAGGACC